MAVLWYMHLRDHIASAVTDDGRTHAGRTGGNVRNGSGDCREMVFFVVLWMECVFVCLFGTSDADVRFSLGDPNIYNRNCFRQDDH